MVDAHAHLAHTFSLEEVTQVLATFKQAGGTAVIDTSTEAKDLPDIKVLLDMFPEVYTVVGLHPEAFDSTVVREEMDAIRSTLTLSKTIGIGETGIDYTVIKNENDLRKQQNLFIQHIEIAETNKLPLVIHARGEAFEDMRAYTDVLALLEQQQFSRGVYFHSFGGDIDTAKKILDLDYVIGVNGICTYSSAKALAEVIAYAPLSAMLLETDTPYLIPSNMDRNQLLDKARNEPSAIWHTAKRIAKIKALPHEDILLRTERNTRMFFERML